MLGAGDSDQLVLDPVLFLIKTSSYTTKELEISMLIPNSILLMKGGIGDQHGISNLYH